MRVKTLAEIRSDLWRDVLEKPGVFKKERVKLGKDYLVMIPMTPVDNNYRELVRCESVDSLCMCIGAILKSGKYGYSDLKIQLVDSDRVSER